jgi:phytol kinase
MTDLLAVLVSFLYVGAAIGLGTALQKWRGYSREFTRKFIHIAVGLIAIPTVLLFKDVRAAIIPPAAFVIINFLDWRFGILQAMQSGDRSNLGTVYFPIAFIAVLLVFWGRPQLVVAAMMPLTWGDALAAIVGVRFGRRKYTLLGYTRTFEGSLALFLITTLTTFLALVIIPPGLTIDRAAVLAAITALGAGLVEALSPHGLDNLTIPAISILILALFA